jgi:hypothetical protein
VYQPEEHCLIASHPPVLVRYPLLCDWNSEAHAPLGRLNGEASDDAPHLVGLWSLASICRDRQTDDQLVRLLPNRAETINSQMSNVAQRREPLRKYEVNFHLLLSYIEQHKLQLLPPQLQNLAESTTTHLQIKSPERGKGIT